MKHKNNKEKLIKQKAGSLKISMKLINLYLNKTGEKGEKTSTTGIRNERRDVTEDPTGVKEIIKEYYEQLYSCEVNNSDEMEIDLKRYKLQKPIQDGLETPSDQITIKLIGFIVKILPSKETPGPDNFIGEFY